MGKPFDGAKAAYEDAQSKLDELYRAAQRVEHQPGVLRTRLQMEQV